MRKWVACLCITLLQTANIITSKVIMEVSDREASKLFPYSTPWESMRIQPIIKMLGVEQSHEKNYQKLPIELNTKINDHKQNKTGHKYELKPDYISTTQQPTKINVEKLQTGTNHSPFNLTEEYHSPGSLTTTPSLIFSTARAHQENDLTPSQEEHIQVQPAMSVPYSQRPLTDFNPPAPLYPIPLVDYNTKFSSTPPPTLSPQEKAPLLQTQTVLLPQSESIFYPPRSHTEESSPIHFLKPIAFTIKSSKNNSLPGPNKEYGSSSSSITLPGPLLTSIKSPKENNLTSYQEPSILVQSAASVSYPQNPQSEFDSPSPLPYETLMDYNQRDSSTTPPYPPSSPQEKVQPSFQTETILIIPGESSLFLPKLETIHKPPDDHKHHGVSFVSPISSFPTENRQSVLLPPIQPFDFKLSDPSTIASYPFHPPNLSSQNDLSPPQIISIPLTELVFELMEIQTDKQPTKPASFLLKPLSGYGLPEPFKEHSLLYSTETSIPPLVQAPSPLESYLNPVIDSVLFPPILPGNNSYKEFFLEPATYSQSYQHLSHSLVSPKLPLYHPTVVNQRTFLSANKHTKSNSSQDFKPYNWKNGITTPIYNIFNISTPKLPMSAENLTLTPPLRE